MRKLVKINGETGKIDVYGEHFTTKQTVMLRAITKYGTGVTKEVQINSIKKMPKRNIERREGQMKYSTIVTARTKKFYNLQNCNGHSANLNFNIIMCDYARMILQDAKVGSHTTIFSLPSNIASSDNGY